MLIFNSLDEIKNIKPSVIAFGNFDGIHLGHQEIIKKSVKSAGVSNLKSSVFTFSNHPKNLIKGGMTVKNILYPKEKAEIIESLGIDYLFNIPFNEIIMNMDPMVFIDDLLVDKLRMKEAYCGFNFRFGHKGKGTPQSLLKEGERCGFGLHVLQPYKVDGNIVSSSLIRKLIAEGKIDQCHKYIGRYYSIGGEVQIGNKIGRTIGFPTSNIIVDETMVTPSNGVYVTICIYNGTRFPSITNAGVKPTIGEYSKNVETHIFHFDNELYGKNIKVEFLQKIRDEIKFKDVETLKEQIRKDCLFAKEYHIQHGLL
jgi:riboflavin kinase/FMN adenylyltransferase